MRTSILGIVLMLTNRAAQGHRRMRASVGVGSQFGHRARFHRLRQVCFGHPEETEAHVQEALRISPRDILRLPVDDVRSLREQCCSIPTRMRSLRLRRGIEANRNFPIAHFVLAAALALLLAS